MAQNTKKKRSPVDFLLLPFWNGRERRLRTAWRLLGWLLLLVVILAGGGFALFSFSEALATFALTIIQGVLTVAAFVFSVWAAGRWLDRRSFTDFGFHLSVDWWRQLGFGLLLGAALMALIFLVEWAFGLVRVVETWYVVDGRTPFPLAYLQPIILYLAVGFYEELFARGYLLRNLAEGFHGGPLSGRAAVWLAVLLSSAVFGLLHAANPNATVVSTFNIGAAGILLALGYVLTGELAVPIGLHITWNFFQGNVFGFPVSGTPMTGGSVLRIEQLGPDWLTGGPFGPEAGALGLAAMGLGAAAIWLWAQVTRGQGKVQTELATYSRPPRLQVGTDRPEVGEERL